jgi:hypothetical protein
MFCRWGWTNQVTSLPLRMELWAGAADCDFDKGTYVGTVTVTGAEVVYEMLDDYKITTAHLYIGEGKFPSTLRGSLTVAPGQYPLKFEADEPGMDSVMFEMGASIDQFVIAHADVCGPFPE